MILDDLSRSALYDGLSPRFARAFAWLRTVSPASLPDGRTDLEGDELYVLCLRGAVKPLDQVKWEAHRRYADIQAVFLGTERMLWQALDKTVPGEYAAEKDFLPLAAEAGADFEVGPGAFAVFFPGDAHRPGVEVPGKGPVVKLVVKVKL